MHSKPPLSAGVAGCHSVVAQTIKEAVKPVLPGLSVKARFGRAAKENFGFDDGFNK